MGNKYRLSSTIYNRDKEKIDPKRIIFLSVEGNVTEKEYFIGIATHIREISDNAIVKVEVLGRRSKDNKSAPGKVLELLEECVELRKNGMDTISNEIKSIEDIFNKYSEKYIEKYLNNENDLANKKEFEKDLHLAEYDLNYRRYLAECGGNYESDIYAVVIDRDSDRIKRLT